MLLTKRVSNTLGSLFLCLSLSSGSVDSGHSDLTNEIESLINKNRCGQHTYKIVDKINHILKTTSIRLKK